MKKSRNDELKTLCARAVGTLANRIEIISEKKDDNNHEVIDFSHIGYKYRLVLENGIQRYMVRLVI